MTHFLLFIASPQDEADKHATGFFACLSVSV